MTSWFLLDNGGKSYLYYSRYRSNLWHCPNGNWWMTFALREESYDPRWGTTAPRQHCVQRHKLGQLGYLIHALLVLGVGMAYVDVWRACIQQIASTQLNKCAGLASAVCFVGSSLCGCCLGRLSSTTLSLYTDYTLFGPIMSLTLQIGTSEVTNGACHLYMSNWNESLHINCIRKPG